MKKINAFLIDDENHCIQTLKFELQRHCPMVEVIGEFTSAKKALAVLKERSPDLVFLDIEMPGMSGFEFLEACPKIHFHVIFVTAYDQYALRAFRFAAVDYLLKPIISDNLIEAVDRITSKDDDRHEKAGLQALLHNIRSELSPGLQKIALNTQLGVEFVYVEHISYCQSESNYTHVNLNSGKSYLLSKTLKQIELMLHGFGFCRAHQSYLVNLRHVARLVKTDGAYLIMENGQKIPISKRKKEDVIKQLKQFAAH